ncbi:WW domain-containing oxidoreductase [Verticillium alfalfae VaMs.102]|uniref:WW domain-containing oxidoreductase n=1 Tax=Verticillium alfalfae (strain VaMs.102 / ATCC MYA-4576 / FGSC 10136) TaxID=526221 RepID=C9SNG0_VERA1|nr:WW domain-containing oxidoreductase [Verticillium alfalfae VaMs.102]EEY20325.1 WW domain-containing oxidoreductase [Verticillium alfalfae VaMs.102]
MSTPTFDHDTKASDLVRHYAVNIVNKTILVTGVSPSGLGGSFMQQIAPSKPAKLILAGRMPAKLQKLVYEIASTHPEIKVKTLELDLASFSNVRKAAEMVIALPDISHIDVLVNNAGIMAVPFSLTEDGFDTQFQTCHLGHFLFTSLIMNKILASKEPRIVNISSNGHRLGTMRWTDYNFSDGKYYEKWAAYGQAKTANILMGIALAKKPGDRGLLAFSLHPGGIMTNLVYHHTAPFDDFVEDLRQADARVGTRFMWGFEKTGGKFKDLDEGVATHVFRPLTQQSQRTTVATLTTVSSQIPLKNRSIPGQ